MASDRETRALICAPYGEDSAILEQICREAGFAASSCKDGEDLVEQAADGFLLVLLSEEACAPRTTAALRTIWQDQPSWSHPPLIALLESAEHTPSALADLIAELAISTCLRLERPLQRRELVTAIQAQAAFRLRQYETRDLMLSSATQEQRQRFLLRELEHRVSNMLASLTSLLRMTARTAGDLEQFTSTFGGRLEALARVHQRLSSGQGDLSLRQVIEDCLEPYCRSADQILLEGPDQPLSPKAAISLTMMLHELATNAAKYGAFSSEQGLVQLSWSTMDDADGTRRLQLMWKESGGPTVEVPASQGFGTLMLQQMASAEFRGAAELHFERDGLRMVLNAILR
jgi:two-component sensor histidine kinase